MSLQPGTRRHQQQVARWVKRAPGYRWALTEVLPRVRRNAVLTDLAWRVFAPRHGAGHVDVALHGGRHVVGRDVSLLPVVGVVALGLDDTGVEALVDQVADLQQELGSFRPLVVLDRPAFAAVRRHGYVLEVLTPAASWDGDVTSWTDHVGARLGSIVDHYQLWTLVRAAGGQLDPLDVALLRGLRDRLPEDLQVEVVGRGEEER